MKIRISSANYLVIVLVATLLCSLCFSQATTTTTTTTSANGTEPTAVPVTSTPSDNSTVITTTPSANTTTTTTTTTTSANGTESTSTPVTSTPSDNSTVITTTPSANTTTTTTTTTTSANGTESTSTPASNTTVSTTPITPTVNNTIPTTPTVNNTVPTTPTVNNTIPTTPTVNSTITTVNSTAPTVNSTLPTTNNTLPSSNVTTVPSTPQFILNNATVGNTTFNYWIIPSDSLYYEGQLVQVFVNSTDEFGDAELIASSGQTWISHYVSNMWQFNITLPEINSPTQTNIEFTLLYCQAGQFVLNGTCQSASQIAVRNATTPKSQSFTFALGPIAHTNASFVFIPKTTVVLSNMTATSNVTVLNGVIASKQGDVLNAYLFDGTKSYACALMSTNQTVMNATATNQFTYDCSLPPFATLTQVPANLQYQIELIDLSQQALFSNQTIQICATQWLPASNISASTNSKLLGPFYLISNPNATLQATIGNATVPLTPTLDPLSGWYTVFVNYTFPANGDYNVVLIATNNNCGNATTTSTLSLSVNVANGTIGINNNNNNTNNTGPVVTPPNVGPSSNACGTIMLQTTVINEGDTATVVFVPDQSLFGPFSYFGATMQVYLNDQLLLNSTSLYFNGYHTFTYHFGAHGNATMVVNVYDYQSTTNQSNICSQTYKASLNVLYVAPDIIITPVQQVQLGDSLMLTGLINDPGFDEMFNLTLLMDGQPSGKACLVLRGLYPATANTNMNSFNMNNNGNGRHNGNGNGNGNDQFFGNQMSQGQFGRGQLNSQQTAHRFYCDAITFDTLGVQTLTLNAYETSNPSITVTATTLVVVLQQQTVVPPPKLPPVSSHPMIPANTSTVNTPPPFERNSTIGVNNGTFTETLGPVNTPFSIPAHPIQTPTESNETNEATTSSTSTTSSHNKITEGQGPIGISTGINSGSVADIGSTGTSTGATTTTTTTTNTNTNTVAPPSQHPAEIIGTTGTSTGSTGATTTTTTTTTTGSTGASTTTSTGSNGSVGGSSGTTVGGSTSGSVGGSSGTSGASGQGRVQV